MSDSLGTKSWLESGRPRGGDYDAAVAQRLVGQSPHGEADFVEELCRRTAGDSFRPGAIGILDGGCGTGRVGIELARRGFDVMGVDIDLHMLETARQKAPGMSWLLADLAEVRLDEPVDVAVLAGNVLIFVGPGREAAVIRNLAQLLAPGGCLVAGFELTRGGFSLAALDELAAASGLTLVERWSTWDRQPYTAASHYAVSVHRGLNEQIQPAAYDGADHGR